MAIARMKPAGAQSCGGVAVRKGINGTVQEDTFTYCNTVVFIPLPLNRITYKIAKADLGVFKRKVDMGQKIHLSKILRFPETRACNRYMKAIFANQTLNP